MNQKLIKYLRSLFKEHSKSALRAFLVVYILVFALVYADLELRLFSLKDVLGYYGISDQIGKTWDSWKKENHRSLPLDDYLVIPALKVAAPLAFVNSADPRDFVEPLKKGVAHFPSVLPGQKGISIILGHSAPPGWISQNYDSVFSDLSSLNEGDTFQVYRAGKAYTYAVRGKIFLGRGEDIDPSKFDENASNLFLISCWPPGVDNRRIIVQSELIL